MNDKIKIAKTVIKILGGFGVNKVARDMISNNVNIYNRWDQIQALAGSVVITAIVAEKTNPYIDARVDQFANWFEDRIEQEEKPKD